MEEPNFDMDHIQPDPLLTPGAFIDPNPSSNGTSDLKSFSSAAVEPPQPSDQKVDLTSNGNPKPPSSTVDFTVGASQLSDHRGETPASVPRPDWLPPGWSFVERVRASGASAGSRDKLSQRYPPADSSLVNHNLLCIITNDVRPYLSEDFAKAALVAAKANIEDLYSPIMYYVDPVTQRRFRSKKEVLYYLETGSTKKRNSDAESSPATDSTPKRKKSESKVKTLLKNFNYDDVPARVKWELSDIYEGTWRPLMNGADRVPESAKQEWSAAFTYLTLQNGGGVAEFFF